MQPDLEATLAKLISIQSVPNNTAACRDVIAFVKTELEPYGLFMREGTDPSCPWLLATTRDTNTPDVLLAAHLDVVPAADDMFTMQKRDGKLYGRGVFDMKFATACYLEFFKNHADKLSDLNIGVLFTTDEEGGSKSMHDVMATDLRPKVVFLPDGGDNWAIEKRAKGYSAFEVSAHGKTSHGSRPWEGKNALHVLIDALQVLRAKYPLANPADATLQVNALHSGEVFNQTPNYASARVDFRSFSKEEHQECGLFLSDLAKTHGIEVDAYSAGDPVIFNEDAPAVQGFLKVFRDHLGVTDTPFSESYGGTDARFFVEYDIPCIIVEPNGGGRHSAEEWLLADDLGSYYRLIERWLLAES